MRLRVFSPGVLAALLFLACSKGGDAPESARVEPIAPLKDWASVAPRESGPSTAADTTAGLGNSLTDMPSAGDHGPATPARRGPKSTPPAASSTSTPKAGSAATGPRHGLYDSLAKDSLFVIDIADVHELPDLFQDSELGRLYRLPEVVKKMEERGFSMDNARAELLLKAPELAPAMLLAPTLHGPLALAVSGLNAETLGASPTDLPWVVTAVYDAGEQADRLAAVLAPLCASLAQRAQWNLVEKPEPAWGCEAGNERLLLDLDRRGDVFLLRFGGRAAVVRELALARKRSQSNSFASTRVASGAASVESLGAEPGLEMHVQLTPLWDALREGGNRADQRVLQRTGLPQILGGSLAVGRTAGGLAEALTLHSPSGVDLLTHVFTGQPMDRALARCVPARFDNATIFAFDGTRVIPDLCLLMPAPIQSELVRGLSSLRTETGVDLERDVLGNFGPSVLFATSSLQECLSQAAPLEIFVACQVGDGGRAQRTLNAMLVASGRSAEARETLVDGTRVYSISFGEAAATPGAPRPQLHWCILDSVVMATTSLDDLRSAMRGLRGKGEVHAGLKHALEQADEDCFLVSFTAADGPVGAGIGLGRRTEAGLEVSSSDGRAMQSTVMTSFVAGVVSSIAIPKLLVARMEANERAAMATLRYFCSAQAMAQVGAHVDSDRDGEGECLFLPELCGAEPLRGQAVPLRPPLVETSFFEWMAPGVGRKNGYHYRVDLPGKDGRRWPALADMRLGLDSEAAELEFSACAWPMAPSTGRAVYVVDSEGGLFSTDNRGERQAYSATRAPAFDAHWAAEGAPVEDGEYLGRDGGRWTRVSQY
jgi:hypothetical protein